MKGRFILTIALVMTVILFFSFSDDEYKIFDEKRLIHLRDSSAPQIFRNGVLFTYQGAGNKVFLSGSFVKWEKMLPMSQSYFGVWYFFYKESLDEGNYSYKFNVDNFWVLDPKNEMITRDDYDHPLSLLTLPKKLVIYVDSPVFEPKTGQWIFWLENSSAQTIYIYGDFNNWNPYEYRLNREGNLWSISLKLKSGKYAYRFIIDFNKQTLDPHNSIILLNKFNEPCSIVTIP